MCKACGPRTVDSLRWLPPPLAAFFALPLGSMLCFGPDLATFAPALMPPRPGESPWRDFPMARLCAFGEAPGCAY